MDAILEAITRETFGKNEARRTRREGRVPAVLYGGDGKSATPIAVQPKALLKILHSESGQNTLISLKLAGGGDARVLVKDFQIGVEYYANLGSVRGFLPLRDQEHNIYGVVDFKVGEAQIIPMYYTPSQQQQPPSDKHLISKLRQDVQGRLRPGRSSWERLCLVRFAM